MDKKTETAIWGTFAMVFFLLTLLFVDRALGDEPKVKYCKNATTGEIITVPVRTPCPYPTHEI